MNILLQIPSDANTIQAWVSIGQLLLSIAATIGVLVTLFLQQKTLQSQLEIQKMEFVSKSVALKPIFEMKVERDDFMKNTGKVIIIIYIKLVRGTCKLKKFNLTNASFPEFEIAFVSHSETNLPKLITEGETICVKAVYNEESLKRRLTGNVGLSRVGIHLRFDDMLGQPYKQIGIFDGDLSNMLSPAELDN